MQINSDEYFDVLTKAAHKLVKHEKSGGPIPADLDFSVSNACFNCQQIIMPPMKALRCSACKAVLYCSKECSKAGWRYARVPGAPAHKALCASNKHHMERLPETQAILKQFPWGRIESDGTFNRDIARGRYNVLGASSKGFWSHKGGLAPHQQPGPFCPSQWQAGSYENRIAQMCKSFEHLDGRDLLLKKHLTDDEGWKLPSELVPRRELSGPGKNADGRPVMVREFGEPVKDWDSWYRWRKLPKESIAALIMSFPLSVYQLLVHCLKVVNSDEGNEANRVPLHIQLLGVEVELNYLPIFAELALLLPYHDVKLVMFGYSVHKLISEARSKSPDSLAGKCSATSPVFAYNAPKECGSGSLKIFLHGDSPTWSLTASGQMYGGKPDALIACNAGLSSYPDWVPVVRVAYWEKIPFGVTEYAEQSVEHQRAQIGMMIGRFTSNEDHAIELNPFQSPGQRAVGIIRLPNVINGFTLVVVKK